MTRLALWLRAACLWILLATGPGLAQEAAPFDDAAWNALAVRAEEVLDTAGASEAALEALRAEVAGWRDELLRAESTSASRIATLESQISALGPVPEEGATEPAEIAARRAELGAQLEALQAPVRRAEEAYTRADGIIREIDALIRERQTDRLLALGPSPLNPAWWPQAWADASDSLQRTWLEIHQNVTSPALRAEARAKLPLILILLALATLMLARGQRWVRHTVSYLRERSRRGTGVWSFLLSLGLIALPLLGILSLTAALFATEMVGPRLALFLERLPGWAAVLLGIRWLAEQSFNKADDIATVPLAKAERRQARRIANVIAALFVAKSVLDSLTAFDSYPTSTEAVLDFPLLALTGAMLFRLGRVRNDQPDEPGAATEPQLFRMRMARLVGRAAMAIGLVGPVMAAVGYSQAGEALVYPAIETLALIGLVLVLQRVVADFYGLVTGRTGAAAESLWVVLAGFGIAICALPPLALIWGARVADLTEIWARFREGFQFGETRISPTDFLVVLLVFAIGLGMTRLLQGGLRSAVLPKTRLDTGGQTAIVSGIGYLGTFLAAILAITAGGLDLSSLAIVAGALSVGIGFGLQNIVSNFVSGIILLIERPISEGDWIEVNGQEGVVKAISVRSTRIETWDRNDVIVPNADLVSGTVKNWTRGNVLGRIVINVGVAYGTDTRKVERILLEIARQHEAVLMNPAPAVDFTGFGADSLDFRIRAVLHDIYLGMAVRTEMRHQIVERFKEEGIEIPFAQRDVWLRNPEALRGEG